ncbi:MAG TPA: PfkB family carbohydrate kinase [Caulobacteraceae bacterium]|nr:PfkB family carbohydrate kinase [Caulobacteraceae bacterium]
MPLALILSSHVAGSRVGGSAQALSLAPFRIAPVEVPTVLFGRHPGWGAPGGAAVEAATFEGMLEGIEANGLFDLADLVITGYFVSPEQVAIAARAIRRCPNARIVVDPIMGDAGRELYVKPQVAAAIARELVPLADVVAPNAWELSRLSGIKVDDAASAVEAARRLGRPTLVSSIDCGEEIGVVYATPEGAWLAAHRKLEHAPNGTGDLLTALFAAAMLEDLSPPERLARAVGGVALAVEAAQMWQAPELPIVALGARLKDEPAPVRIEKIT